MGHGLGGTNAVIDTVIGFGALTGMTEGPLWAKTSHSAASDLSTSFSTSRLSSDGVVCPDTTS